MPVPTAYTEESFTQYLTNLLERAGLSVMLTWVSTHIDEIVVDTLLAYGVNDITEAGDIAKLRALGALQLWEAVAEAAVLEINYTADGATMNREAIYQHAVGLVGQARIAALPYTDDWQVGNHGVNHADDPYRPLIEL